MDMEDQTELWKRVVSAKRKVLDAIHGIPDHQFRSSQVFQAYTGLCGEAEFAHDDHELTEELVVMLEEYSAKVFMAWQEYSQAAQA